jgi:hypothetical protein
VKPWVKAKGHGVCVFTFHNGGGVDTSIYLSRAFEMPTPSVQVIETATLSTASHPNLTGTEPML